jgi:hypothetical protein
VFQRWALRNNPTPPHRRWAARQASKSDNGG